MNKEELIAKIKNNTKARYEMPDLKLIEPTEVEQLQEVFVKTCETVGAQVVVTSTEEPTDLAALVRILYPEAKEIASNLPEMQEIATRNPDTVDDASDLNGTDVAAVRGQIGVAENGCIWVPQTMKERAVCFISEYLVILLSREAIVRNLHQAYQNIRMTDYGYGCFISGPSKTADIAQALVMGAQAARGVTVVITD